MRYANVQEVKTSGEWKCNNSTPEACGREEGEEGNGAVVSDLMNNALES